MVEGNQDRADDRDQALRALILTPRGRDSALAQETLARNGVASCICADLHQLRLETTRGAGCLLIAEEALPRINADHCNCLVGVEPSWSSLPILVLLGRGSSFPRLPLLRALEARPNVSFLERPVPRRTLVSATRAAVEARKLQYKIRDTLEELKAANRKKDEFLATLSHELRNPLAPIRNAISVLRHLLGDHASGETVNKLLSMVERQTDHLVRLVDDLLEVSRITTGKVKLKISKVNLHEVVRQAVEISEPLITAARHQLKIRETGEDLFVEGDAVRLTQVVTNLLTNSARYTPTGGTIAVTLRRESLVAVVSVADNGIGISENMLPRVFELFSQSRAAASGGKGGLGVGLALVKDLVEMHGGAVAARSDGVGRGSEFVVRLPLTTADDVASVMKAKAPNLDLAGRRVLIVDDNHDVADSLAMLLNSFGADVRVAYSGSEALSCISDFKPDLAFLDLGMPEVDGCETARRIRLTSQGADMRLIAVSGWGQEKDRQLAKEAGFTEHFTKPITISSLRQIMETVDQNASATNGLLPMGEMHLRN